MGSNYPIDVKALSSSIFIMPDVTTHSRMIMDYYWRKLLKSFNFCSIRYLIVSFAICTYWWFWIGQNVNIAMVINRLNYSILRIKKAAFSQDAAILSNLFMTTRDQKYHCQHCYYECYGNANYQNYVFYGLSSTNKWHDIYKLSNKLYVNIVYHTWHYSPFSRHCEKWIGKKVQPPL